MSRKRKIAGFDEIEKSPQEELYDALYSTGNSCNILNAIEIFNKPFILKDVLAGLEGRLSDLLENFSEGTTFGYVDGFIHFDDVISLGEITKGSAMRRYNHLEDEFKRLVNPCKYHPGSDCKMIEQHTGFLLYLSWLSNGNKEEEDNVEDLSTEGPSEETPVDLMDFDDVESVLDEQEEKALVQNFDPAKFRAETITKVEAEGSVVLEEGDEVDTLECIPVFPTYCFNQREYVLLNDIQNLFGLREDFALACLANWGKFDKEFVDSCPCPLSILDTNGDNFIEKERAAVLCIEMIEEFERCGLPSEEEFMQLQETMGISGMGLEGPSTHSDMPQINETKSSIDLYTEHALDVDETPQVNVVDL